MTIPASEVHVYREVDGRALGLELVRPAEAPAPSPAVILFHGGAWRMGSRDQFLPQCRDLAARGTVAITASYRLADRDRKTTPLQCADAAAHALEYARHEQPAQ